MSPLNHHISSSYLHAYAGELVEDMRTARATHGRHGLRRRVGRSMVAIGARIASDPATIVDGQLVILDRPTNHDLPRAA